MARPEGVGDQRPEYGRGLGHPAGHEHIKIDAEQLELRARQGRTAQDQRRRRRMPPEQVAQRARQATKGIVLDLTGFDGISVADNGFATVGVGAPRT